MHQRFNYKVMKCKYKYIAKNDNVILPPRFSMRLHSRIAYLTLLHFIV